MYAFLKKHKNGEKLIQTLHLLPTIVGAEKALTLEVEAAMRNLNEHGKSFTVERCGNAYVHIFTADGWSCEWLISSNVTGSNKSLFAVATTYSWALDDPYATHVELFDTEDAAREHLAQSYRAEVDSDRENGYNFASSISDNREWAEIVNYRKFGDGGAPTTDITTWMSLKVIQALPVVLQNLA